MGVFEVMILTPKDIEEFKTTYREAVGDEITDKEATEMAARVMQFYEVQMEVLRKRNDGDRQPTPPGYGIPR